MRIRNYLLGFVVLTLAIACEKKDESATDEKEATATQNATEKVAPAAPKQGPSGEVNAAPATSKAQASEKKEQPSTKAAGTPLAIGESAPDFSLVGVDGNSWKLSDHKGKVVVLEWFNPECPYVKIAHNTGQLKTAADRLTKKGVVYVAINSNAEGKQGFGREKNLAGQKAFNLTHPILLDPKGTVGKQYRATRTPHMMVIDASGKLAYRGAVDNTGGGDASDAPMGVVVNYVEKAVDELLAGKPVSESEVRPWGCGVKYAK